MAQSIFYLEKPLPPLPRCPRCRGWLYREGGGLHCLPCGWDEIAARARGEATAEQPDLERGRTTRPAGPDSLGAGAAAKKRRGRKRRL